MPIKFLRQIHLTNRGDTLCLIWKEKKSHKVTFRTRQGDQWVDVTTSELSTTKQLLFSHYRVRSRQLVHLLTYHVITSLHQCSKNMA